MGSPAPPECWERTITARISNHSNAFETTLSSPMGATDTTATVVTTVGGPTSPGYLCIDPEVPAKREYIYFDGTFTGTTFVTSTTANRHLAGSAAASGLTHDSGAVVRSVPAAQMFTDLHDRVTNHPHDGTANGGVQLDHGAALTGLTDNDHTQYQLSSLLTTRGDTPYRGASAWARLAIGAADTLLTTDGTDPSWAKITAAKFDTTLARRYLVADATALAALTGMREGDVADVASTDLSYRYSGTAWVVVGGSGAWTTYNPAWTTSGTAPAIGNGTLKGAYKVAGKTLELRITFIAGSSTTFGTGEFRFGLPSGIAGVTDANIRQSAPVNALDNGTNYHIGVAGLISAGTFLTITSELSGSVWAATTPHTWANADYLHINGVFEIA